MRTWVQLPFGNGEYVFKLLMGGIDEIERACSAGVGEVYARTLKGRFGEGEDDVLPTEAAYRFRDLVEVIRQGLIGGGEGIVDGVTVPVSDTRANQLIERYLLGPVDRMPMRKAWKLAASILFALIEGYNPPGEDDAGESPATAASA